MHAQVHKLLQKYGWNSVSFQVLEPGFLYHFVDDDSCVAYADTGRAWVAAGPPIAARERWPAVAEAFMQAARQARRRPCFFAVEQPFVHATHLQLVQVGAQPVWDPERWATLLRSHRSLREQLRRARSHGVRVRRVPNEEVAQEPLRRRMEQLIARWRATRAMAALGFVVQVAPLSAMAARHYYAAESARGLEGMLVLAPVYTRQGWLFENLVRDPRAPNGTAELLIDAAMGDIAAAGARYATLGLAPLAGGVSPGLQALARWSRPLYDFHGLHAFKAKLRPQQWDAIFVAYPHSGNNVQTVLDVLAAFAPGGLWRFALRTLLRGPDIVLKLLTVLLVPWTLALALADTGTWFPWPWVQQFWVGFDLALLVALLRLNRRWHQGLATALATAVSLDTFVTAAEAVAFPQPAGLVGYCARLAAVAAPTLASIVLWNARKRGLVGQ